MSKTRKKIESLLKRVSKLNEKIKKLRASGAKKKKKSVSKSSAKKKAPPKKRGLKPQSRSIGSVTAGQTFLAQSGPGAGNS